MSPAEYLKKPYSRIVVPDSDNTFRGEIVEFPGCIAVGSTAAEALANLEEVAAIWLEGAIEKGQRIPDPIDDGSGFSGKLVVRLSKSLHKRSAHQAAREGVSLNQFIVTCIAEKVGASSAVGTALAFTAVHTGPRMLIGMTLNPTGTALPAPADRLLTSASSGLAGWTKIGFSEGPNAGS